MPPPRRRIEPATASTIFVDREEPKRVFEEAVFSIPEDGCSLRVWYGVGGQGKTALARELFRMSAADADPAYAHVRRAMLDLHDRPKTDPDRLIVWIRNAFARAGIRFPAFDLAFAIMWEKTRGEEPLPNLEAPWVYRDALAESMPDAVLFSRQLVEEFAETIPALGFLLRRGTHWAFNKSHRAWLEQTRPQLQALYRDGRLINDYEIADLMPWMLAQDMNRHLEAHLDERFVLFVDEYESVMDGAGTGARWRENKFDLNVRSFIAETNGLLGLFFSRERLPWADDPDWRDCLEGNQHLLGGLSDTHADAWLLQVPIESAQLRSAIIEGARQSRTPEAPIYPLMLDLQVEHWRNLGDAATEEDFSVSAPDFESRRRELVTRLLRDYGDPVQNALTRLAVARRFDREAFAHVVTSFNIPLAFDDFYRLADLSIMSLDEDGWLSPHRAIADAIIAETPHDQVAESRSELRDHFQRRAKPDKAVDVTESTLVCLTEAAFLRRQDGIEGYAGWLEEAGKRIEEAHRPEFLENLWRQSLAETVSVLGEGHPDTGKSYNNVAFILDDQGRYNEAEPLYRKGLEIRRAALGETHPDTGESYNNVAYNLQAQGRYEEAEPLYRKDLEISRAALGETHPDTGKSYNNVAYFLNAQGRYEEAEPLLMKALEISIGALGETHPDTGQSYNNVASNLNAQGRHEEAEPLFQKGLEIRRAALGETHPDTGGSYNNVASNLNAQGRHEEAEPFFQKGLEIRRAALGETHPDTGESYNNVASNLEALGRHEEAEPFYLKALEAVRDLPQGHPTRTLFEANLAVCRVMIRHRARPASDID